MMLTRCPACQTAFRVRPEQLRLRQGRVRCGSCGKAFNALETLLEEQAEAPDDELDTTGTQPPGVPKLDDLATGTAEVDGAAQPQPLSEWPPAPEQEHLAETEAEAEAAYSRSERPAATESRNSIFVLEERAGPEISGETLLQASFTPITPDDSADLLIESFQRYRPKATPPLSFAGAAQTPAAEFTEPAAASPDDAADATHEAAATEVDFLADPDADLSAQAEARQAEGLDVVPGEPYIGSAQPKWPELHQDDESADAPEDQFDAPGMPALLAERQEGEAADESFEAREAAEMAITPLLPPELSQEEPEKPSNDAGLEALDETPGFELEPASRPRTWAWGLGIGVLTIGLLAQGAILYRQDIMQRLPQSRPLYAQLCARIGCSMALPQEAAKIAIESSDLHPEPGVANFFRLRATIRNRASFEQAYPHLELTLTDATDRALARKVLDPAQWRSEDAPADGFPAGRDIEVNVPFEARDVAAVGYRIYVFYP